MKMYKSNNNDTFAKNGLNNTSISRKRAENRSFLNERIVGLLGLLFCLVVIGVKIFYEHNEAVNNLLFKQKLMRYEILTEDGQVMWTYAWETVAKYKGILWSIAVGFLVTYFTWMCYHLDSAVPGVVPPSPLSPKRYQEQSGRRLHLNYAFAILLGVVTTGYMLFSGF